jgi:CTP-dependent riboflavin kinase
MERAGAPRNFVGPQPGKCEHPDRFCEIVSEVNLREELRAGEGQVVAMWFGWEW